VAAIGTILIPASIAFVVCGVLAEVPIGCLFTAGIVPSILLGLCLIAVSLFFLRNRKGESTRFEPNAIGEKRLVFKEAS